MGGITAETLVSMVSLLVFPQCMHILTDFTTEGTDGLKRLGSVAHLQVLLDVRPAMRGLVRAAWAAEHLAPFLVKTLIHFITLKIL